MRSEEVVIVRKMRREKGRDTRLLALRLWYAAFYVCFFFACWRFLEGEMLRPQHFYNKSQVVSCYWFKFETNTKITFLPSQ